jgi:uncharacterized protein YbjT (DUF2867 family)
VRAGSFYENYLFGLQAAQGGTLPVFYTPTARKLPMIATQDIGAEVAKLLTSEWTNKRVIELGSMVSCDDLATAIGEVLGRDVKARAIPREAWAETLQQLGLPKGGTWAYEEMIDSVNSGWITFGVTNTERVEGTTSAEQFFATAKASN